MTDQTNQIVDTAIEIASREGIAPEQEHFMTAAVQNRKKMTAQERQWLDDDLAAIEPQEDVYWDDDEDDWYDENYDEQEYDEFRCPDCGYDLGDCICLDDYWDEEESYHIVAQCTDGWYGFDLNIAESCVDAAVEELIAEHEEHCDCGMKPQIYTSIV